MSDLEARIAEAVSTHLGHYGDEYDLSLSASNRKLGRDVAAMLAPLIREREAAALRAEAVNLRELHTLIEDTPWNPMPSDDKARCMEFMGKSGVPEGEYEARRMTNYADWLDHRADQIEEP